MSVRFFPPGKVECPMCQCSGSIYEGKDVELMCSDYIIYPMIWCYRCEAVCVIDPDSYKKTIEGLERDDNGEVIMDKEHTVPLLLIKRVSPEALYEGKISEEDLDMCTETWESGKKNWKEFEEFSLPVESYDVSQPKNPYPEGTDLSHDGIYVLIQVQELDGNTTVIAYWGD